MTDWAFVIAGTDGTEIVDVPKATGRTLAFDVDGPHSARWTTRGDDPAALATLELATDLIIYRDGQRFFRGRVGASRDVLTESTHMVEWSAVSYRGVLDRRITWWDTAMSPMVLPWFPTDDVANVAWQLVNLYQRADIDGGDMGITNAATPTGVTATFASLPQTIPSALAKLSDYTGGFDWDISADLEFQLWHPGRGTTQPFWAAVWGDTITALTRTVDPALFATDVIASGADHGPNPGDPGPPAVRLGVTPHGPPGRIETYLSFPDATTTDTLTAAAQANLDRSSTITPSYEATIRAAEWTPEEAWIGDIVRLVIHSGRLHVDTTARIVKVDWRLGDTGADEIKLTFDRKPSDELDRIGAIQDQLLALIRQ